MSNEFSGDYDAEMEAIMKQKFADRMITNPQQRAEILVRRYVNTVNKILDGSVSYKEDVDMLAKIKEEAASFGLKITLDVQVVNT